MLLLTLCSIGATAVADDSPIGTWVGWLYSDNCDGGTLSDWIFYHDNSTEGAWDMSCLGWYITSDDASGTYTLTNGILTAHYEGWATEDTYWTTSHYDLYLTDGWIIPCDAADGNYTITFDNPLWHSYGLGSDTGGWFVIRTSDPCKAINPSPSDGTINQSIDVDLSWTNGGGACTFDVYFGTDNPPTELIYSDINAPTCDPGTLLCGTTYYWRTHSKNTNDTATGDVWRFSTEYPDLTGEEKINLRDLAALASYWDDICIQPGWCEGTDFDRSGRTYYSDLKILTQFWLTDAGLVGHWRFDEDSGTIAADSSIYNNPGSLVNGPTWTGQGELSFDGIDDYVDIADDPSLDMTTKLTVALWMKQPVLAINKALAAKWDFQTQGCWTFQTDNVNPDELMVFIATALDDNGSGGNGKTTNANMTAESWYHVAFVYDGDGAANADRLKVYVDGQEKTLSFAGTIPSLLQDSSASVKIGKFGGILDRYFNGIIDDVRIYNRALSAEEMLELAVDPNYQSQLSPIANAGLDKTVIDADSNGFEQIDLDGSQSTDPDGTIVSYVWTEDGNQLATGANPTVVLSVGEHPITLTVTDDSNLKDTDTVTITVAGSGLVGHWQFDEGSGTIAADSSGYNNVGSLINGPTWTVQGELSFDGVDDYVDIADDPSLDMTTKLTVALWINQPVLATDKALTAKWDYQTQGCWAFQTANINSDELMVFIATRLGDNGSGGNGKTTGANMATGSWYHVAFVYDGEGAANADRLKVYVDGQEKTLSFAGTIPSFLQNSSASVKIGEFGGILHRYFNGLIDDVRIYERPLSTEEVLQLYQDGAN
ncbi:MAG: LamG-like jellyroll fold domain-containing protein [Planctomycetota bacterium]